MANYFNTDTYLKNIKYKNIVKAVLYLQNKAFRSKREMFFLLFVFCKITNFYATENQQNLILHTFSEQYAHALTIQRTTKAHNSRVSMWLPRKAKPKD